MTATIAIVLFVVLFLIAIVGMSEDNRSARKFQTYKGSTVKPADQVAAVEAPAKKKAGAKKKSTVKKKSTTKKKSVAKKATPKAEASAHLGDHTPTDQSRNENKGK